MPYDYEDISTLNDRDLYDLAIEYEIPNVPNLVDGVSWQNDSVRLMVIDKLRKKGVNTRSNALFNINEQILEYQEMFPYDTAEKQLYEVRVPPQTGVRPSAPSGGRGRGGGTIGDNTWYTAYTTPGGAQFLMERGYEVQAVDDANGVVITLPRHRRRADQTVEIEAPYGRHHRADVQPLEPQ